MDIFTANKKAGYNMTLGELRQLTPAEGWMLKERIQKELALIKERLEQISQKHKF